MSTKARNTVFGSYVYFLQNPGEIIQALIIIVQRWTLPTVVAVAVVVDSRVVQVVMWLIT